MNFGLITSCIITALARLSCRCMLFADPVNAVTPVDMTYREGVVSRFTQCAAVRTQSSVSSVPPHVKLLL